MKLLLILYVTTILFLPQAIFAQEGLVTCEGPDCNLCSVVTMANGLIDWLFGIAVLIAVILIAYAGFLLVFSRGDVNVASRGKRTLTNAVIGIIIMLAAWTIVDTFMKVFLGGDFGVWNEVQQCGGSYKVGETKKGINLNTQSVTVAPPKDLTTTKNDEPATVVKNTGGSNCPGASPSEVVTVPGEGNYKLVPSAAQNYVAMRTAAASDGVHLKLSSAWRSQAKQEEIWNRHNCDAGGCSGKVGKPCSKGGNGSNHNSGVAIDISGSYMNTKIYNWLKTNGGRFGFYNKLGARDPVHWSPSGR